MGELVLLPLLLGRVGILVPRPRLDSAARMRTIGAAVPRPSVAPALLLLRLGLVPQDGRPVGATLLSGVVEETAVPVHLLPLSFLLPIPTSGLLSPPRLFPVRDPTTTTAPLLLITACALEPRERPLLCVGGTSRIARSIESTFATGNSSMCSSSSSARCVPSMWKLATRPSTTFT